MGWPLPLYELALMTAHRAWDMGIELSTTIITPEDQPLGVFGATVSDGVADLLKKQNVHLMTSAHAEVPHRRQLVMNPGNRKLDVDRIIALPELFGPAITGLPQDEYGFITVDEFSRVPDAGPVFAAGDVTNYPIKHGGIASQMADAAAQSIAALAGVAVTPKPLDPILRGMLLTGRSPRYMYAHRVGDHAFDSEFSETPIWDPPSKISSVYLAPYLAELERAATEA
jgi:sulfide:quinone oxidoreductase